MTMTEIRAAYAKHRAAADEAFRLYVAYCGGSAPRRVPGMSTDIRLACRIHNGKTIEEAAAREYVYRWHLAIKPFDQCGPGIRNPCCSVFGTPHTIGM